MVEVETKSISSVLFPPKGNTCGVAAAVVADNA
jgi:hypothetical protein